MKDTKNGRQLGDVIKEPDKLIYITVALMLVVMATIIGITAASNRARKNKLPDPMPADSVSDSAKTEHTRAPIALTDAPTVTGEPTAPVTDAPESTAPTAVDPTRLDAPVAGSIIKPHSPDVLLRSITMNDYRAHVGIDISAPIGEAVRCCADGIVKEVWNDPMMGRCVSIAHSGGLVTVMKNLDNTLASGIEPGRELAAGDVIGAIGETALIEICEMPHLHIETELDGKAVDPMGYFDQSVFADASEDYEG